MSGDELDSHSDGEPSFIQSSPVPKFLASKHEYAAGAAAHKSSPNNTTLNSSTSNLSTDSSSNATAVSDSFVPLAYQNEPSTSAAAVAATGRGEYTSTRSPSYGDKGSQPPEQVSSSVTLPSSVILGWASIK